MPQKAIVMSLSVTPEFHNLLKNAAKTRVVSISSLVRELTDKYLPLVTSTELQKKIENLAKERNTSPGALVSIMINNQLSKEIETASISPLLSAEMQNKIENIAKKRNVSPGVLVTNMINNQLPSETEIPVVIKIPASLKGNEAELKKWLDSKTNSIVQALK